MQGDTESVDLPCEEADRFGEVPAPVRHCAMSCLAAEYRGGLVEADGVAAQSRGAGSLQSRGTAADDRHGLRGHRRCHHEFKLTNAGGVDRTECRLIAGEKRHALSAGDAPADLIQTALSGLQ